MRLQLVMTKFLRILAIVSKAERSESFAAWFTWAMGRAERMDPLTEPARIAKALRLAASTCATAGHR